MRICRKCGAQVADGVMACPQCGAPMIEPPKTPQQDVEQNKVMAVLAYFGILVLIPILAAKESKFARFQPRSHSPDYRCGLLHFCASCHQNRGIHLLRACRHSGHCIRFGMASPIGFSHHRHHQRREG